MPCLALGAAGGFGDTLCSCAPLVRLPEASGSRRVWLPGDQRGAPGQRSVSASVSRDRTGPGLGPGRCF